MKKSGASQGQSASELISQRIAELGDWRGKTLGKMRKLIKEADPDVVEEWKWMGTPVWSHDGIINGQALSDRASVRMAHGSNQPVPGIGGDNQDHSSDHAPVERFGVAHWSLRESV